MKNWWAKMIEILHLRRRKKYHYLNKGAIVAAKIKARQAAKVR